jgi:hypothetical protein
MNRDNTIAISPTCQEKYKHIQHEIIKPKIDSIATPNVSDVKPLRFYISYNIVFTKIPGALLLSSNHPISLCIIASKSYNRIL